MSNTFGNKLKLKIFGSSHADAVGGIIEGLPAGFVFDEKLWQKQMKRRCPGQSILSSARREDDKVIIKSGLDGNVANGHPLEFTIPNEDKNSADYQILQDIPRPGHGDYSQRMKYGDKCDLCGGGMASGRMTSVLTFAGALAMQLLCAKKIRVYAHIYSVGEIYDTAFNPLGEDIETLQVLAGRDFPVLNEENGIAMKQLILQQRQRGDSVGGIIECMVLGLRAGIGEPFFGSVESRLSAMLYSIPGVKAVEFGDGFGFTTLFGSGANDAFYYDDKGVVRTRTNHNGGINAGITNGMPVLFRIGIKPTPSISLPQESINLVTGKNVKLTITGRHDPCIVHRAVPVTEAVAAFVLTDLMMEGRLYD